MHRPLNHHPLHLTIDEIIAIKLGLSLAFFATIIFPPPYNIPISLLANLIWVWRL